MIYEIDKYTDVLCKGKITPNQFYICWLLYTKDDVNLQKYINMKGGLDTADLQDLIDKGFILNSNPKALAFSTANLFVSLEFGELVLIESEDAWDELFNAYPAYLIVNQNKIPAKTFTFTDERLAKEAYTNILKKNKFLHKRIIEAVEKYKEQNSGYATIKLDKFITGKHWEEIDKQDEQQSRPRIY